MFTDKSIKSFVVVFLLSVLSACGDGGGADGVAGAPIVGLDITPPSIIGQTPPVAGTASIDVVVSLTFNEEIDISSITEGTIQLTGPNGPVPGAVSYDTALKKVNFVSENYLMPFSEYQVDFGGVSDVNKNLLEQSPVWTFTTIFDQIPPGLPDF